MKIKLLPTMIAAGFLTAPFALAANYQSEISAVYADTDVNDDPQEGYFVGLKGKYYFSPVDTKNHPLAEAAFIEKASNLYIKLDNSEAKAAGIRSDTYERSIGVDFYIPNTMFYLGAGVNEVKEKYTLPAGAGTASTKWDSEWFVKAGVAPVTGLLVWTEFTEDIDVSDQWNINGKYVIPLSGEQALNIEASYEKSDIDIVESTIAGAADYYLDSNLSMGAGFINESYRSNADSTTDYFVRARNFFTDNISAELAYIDGDYERSLVIGGTVRF